MSTLSTILRQLRTEKDLSQKQVADSIGITRTAYSNYEQGLREPSLQILVKIASFFEVSAGYVLGIENDFGIVNIVSTASPLPLDEEELLNNYRALSYSAKTRVVAYTDLLREQEEATKATSRKKA